MKIIDSIDLQRELYLLEPEPLKVPENPEEAITNINVSKSGNFEGSGTSYAVYGSVSASGSVRVIQTLETSRYTIMECHYDITTSYSYTNAFTNTLSNKTRTQYIDFPEINFVSPIQDTMKIRVTCNVTYYTSSSPYNRYIECQPSISVEQPYLEERHLTRQAA